MASGYPTIPVLNTTSPAVEQRDPKRSPEKRLPSCSNNSAFDTSVRKEELLWIMLLFTGRKILKSA